MFEEKKIKRTIKTAVKKAAPAPKKAPVKKRVVKKPRRTKKDVLAEMEVAAQKLREAKKGGTKEERQKWNKVYNELANESTRL
tara:strand:- start:1213 stop:1461 length:249 start_codon:yes stop_codon:yes gene_type:complete